MEGAYRWLPPLGPAVEKWQVRHHDWGSEYRSEVVHAKWRLEVHQRTDPAGRPTWASARRQAANRTLSATYEVLETHLMQVVENGREIRRADITVPWHFSFASPVAAAAGLHITCYDYGRGGRHQHPVFWVDPETLEGRLIQAWFEFVNVEETEVAGENRETKHFIFNFNFEELTTSQKRELWIDREGTPVRIAVPSEGRPRNTHVLLRYKRFTR